jgi:hypothetical protein
MPARRADGVRASSGLPSSPTAPPRPQSWHGAIRGGDREALRRRAAPVSLQHRDIGGLATETSDVEQGMGPSVHDELCLQGAESPAAIARSDVATAARSSFTLGASRPRAHCARPDGLGAGAAGVRFRSVAEMRVRRGDANDSQATLANRAEVVQRACPVAVWRSNSRNPGTLTAAGAKRPPTATPPVEACKARCRFSGSV